MENEKDLNLFQTLVDEVEDDDDDSQLSPEELQLKKNKDAEEARKRREAEAKKKLEDEAAEKLRLENEAKAKAEADQKAALEKAEAEKLAVEEKERLKALEEKKSKAQKELGKQLLNFGSKYPDVDLAQLDKDASFNKFAKGKFLGKQNFTEIYEDFLSVRSELSGKSADEVQKSYAKKAQASSGGSTGGGGTTVPDGIYTEKEFDALTERIPFLSDKELEKVQAKYEKSLAHYKKQK